VELVLPARLLAQAMSRSLFSPPAGLAHGHELGGVLRYERGTKVLHQTIQYLRERQEFEDEWLASWAESPVPCSLVWGQLDSIATAALGDFLWDTVLSNRSSSSARYVKVDDGNHYLMGDHPQTVAGVIMRGPPTTTWTTTTIQ
jgi:pimeloyl-ACP methyl ester carboxylesterase